jgi:glycosidase
MFSGTLANGLLPEWARGAVWYQIVVERFRNFNSFNDPIKGRVVKEEVEDWQVHPWTADFYKQQVWEESRGLEFYDLLEERRYGGDLQGVREKLPYLKELGVDVIFLNPVFESPSVLKYDASTFHHVDNNFGVKRKEDWEKIQAEKEDPAGWTLTSSDEVFLDLVAEAHKQDIRVVIEAQFAYCSRTFWAFKDVEKNQKESPYRDWFEVTAWDDPVTPDTVEFEYETWQNNPEWPVFRQDDYSLVEPVKSYIFNITSRWMTPVRDEKSVDGIDGWYINSSQGDIHPAFWKQWIRFVKTLNSDAVTVAEVPLNASGQNGDIDFDLYINHDLGDIIKTFFINPPNEWTISDFNAKLKKMRHNLSGMQSQGLITRPCNQSTMRLASMIKNPEAVSIGKGSAMDHHGTDQTRPGKENVAAQKLIALFYLTYMGSPMIFYGDENGMLGGRNPNNLKPMLWREFLYEQETRLTGHTRPDSATKPADGSLFQAYSKLNQVRQDNPALRTGSCEPIFLDNAKGIFAFSRKLEQNEVLVFINTSDAEQVITYPTGRKRGTKVKDLLKDKGMKLRTIELELKLDPKWGAILAIGK